MNQENSMKMYFLRSNVVAEPLINSWYAWSFLVYPPTFARVTKNLHLNVLRSYLKAPKLHETAIKNRALRGGLYVEHQGTIDQIEELVASTESYLSKYIQLSEDIDNLNQLIDNDALGESLNNLYSKLPESLRGTVELTYDLRNNPNFRFIEPYFYKSHWYDESIQSIRLSKQEGDHRPFVLSSPRLASDNSISLKAPFRNKKLDVLFCSRYQPISLDEIKEIAEESQLNSEEFDKFLGFFTTQKFDQPVQPVIEDIRVDFYGHATVLLQNRECSVLTDPIISYDHMKDGRLSFKDLPEKIDYVIITHNHQDHVMIETLLQLRNRIGTVVVPRSSNGTLQDMSLKLMLQAIGFNSVIDISELDSVQIPGGFIKGIPFLGEHGDLAIQSKLAFVVELGNYRSMFAADSNNIDPVLYEKLADEIGELDDLFVGMECVGAPMTWLYGSLYTKKLERKFDHSRRLDGSNSERALTLVETLKPRRVSIYAMGFEPWLTFISSIEFSEDNEAVVECRTLEDMLEKSDIQVDSFQLLLGTGNLR